MKKTKLISLMLAAVMCLGTLFALIACQQTPVQKDEYTFTFDVNYEGGNNRVDTVKAGYRANYYAARRSGYTLKNWYTTKDCLTPFDFSTKINQDYTVYALWEKKGDAVNVTFHYNYNKSLAPVTVEGEEGKVIDPQTVPDPRRLGYEVEGWYTDKECTQRWDVANDSLTGDIDLYAKYNYTANLKFDSQGKVVLNNVDVNISIQFLSWTGKRSLAEIVDEFNDEYAGKIHLNWTSAYSNEVARFEDPGMTNSYLQNNYRFGELLDLVGIDFDDNDYYAEAIAENYVGDALMTYPVGHMVPSVMYNKALLAEMGESEPQTHADFVRLLEKATATFGTREGYTASLAYEGNEWQWFEVGSNNIWANNDLLFYSYDKQNKTYINNYAQQDCYAKAANAVKGYAELFNNDKISLNNEVLWESRQGFNDVVDGNAFMGIVSYPKMYTYYLNNYDQQLFKKIGILPIANLFNYGNIDSARTFVKGISLCLPSDTDATFDIEQLAAIGVFADYLSRHSGRLAYNDCYPASKTGQNSTEFTQGTTKYFKVLKAVGDPSKFVTLPGSQNEYYCFNYQNQACVQSLSFISADMIDADSLIRQAIKGIADATATVIK